MKTNWVGSFVLVMLACSGNGGETPDFRAQVGSDFDVARRADLLDHVLEAFVGTARASGGSTVDTAIAILSDGSSLSAPIEDDGTFTFTFEGEITGTWIVLLTCQDAPIDQRIVAYVTMGAGGNTMMSFPPLDEPLDVGTLSRDGDEAVGETRVEDTSSFTLGVEDLLAIAATDDSYKFTVNRYLNTDPETGTFYVPSIEFLWNMPLARDVRAPIAADATPDALEFTGYTLDVQTNDSSFPRTGICNGSVELAARPPSGVLTATATIYGPDAPIRNDEMDSGGSYCASGVAVNPDGSGFNINLGGGQLRGLAHGYWRLEVDGMTRAAFNLGVADPNEGERIRVPVPMPRMTTDADGVVQSMSLEWYLPGADGYTPVVGPERLGLTLFNLVVSFDHSRGQQEYPLDSPTDTIDRFDTPIVLGEVVGTDGITSDKLIVFYRIGELRYSFTFGRDDYGVRPVLAGPPNASVVRPVDTDTNVTVTTVLDPPLPTELTLDWATSDGTATVADGDYVSASGTLVFAPGEPVKSIELMIPAAGELQPDEIFYVDFSNPGNARLDRPRVEVSLLSPVVVSLGDPTTGLARSMTAVEGSDLVVPFHVDPPAPYQIDLTIAFDDALDLPFDAPRAEPGVDFEGGGLTVIAVPPMESGVAHRIPTFADGDVEPNERVTISVIPEGTSNARLVGPALHQATITEQAHVFAIEGGNVVTEGSSIELAIVTATPPTTAVSLPLVAIDGLTGMMLRAWAETFPADATSHSFTVDLPDDSVVTGDYPVLVVLDEHTVTAAHPRQVFVIDVSDDDVELGGVTCEPALDGVTRRQRVRATLVAPGSNTPPTATLRFQTEAGTATEGADFQPLDQTIELQTEQTHVAYVRLIGDDDVTEGTEDYRVRITGSGIDEVVTCEIRD